ncbi:unnamed protein product [Linum tenue]|uniref:Uncharacterized protein n=1 Tax=Linum tenue TaxID=586396 RepID=A0AAV0LCC0_9ROSI|nr:unnamed protein product [Linum tenue]
MEGQSSCPQIAPPPYMDGCQPLPAPWILRIRDDFDRLIGYCSHQTMEEMALLAYNRGLKLSSIPYQKGGGQ